MQSEAENQSPNSEPVSRSQLGSVEKTLQDGDNLMDFIAKNSGRQPVSNPADAVIQADVNKMAEEKNDVVITPPAEPAEAVPDVTVEELEEPEPAPSEEASPEEEESEFEDGLELKGTTAENFKKLRNTVKELKEETSRKDKLLGEVTKELEEYSTGKKIPDELEQREARIGELEHYEKIVNLKKSKYYQDKFVKPFEKINTRLAKMAKDYNIDPKRLMQAANTTNEAELNRFLSQNFDTVGASEVKDIIRECRTLQSEAMAAEKEPAQALNKMIEDAKSIRATKQKERLRVMQDVTRGAWRESLDYIKEEGKIRELMFKEGDVEHNTKVFTPIVKAAAREYGKLVNQLAKNGLESLPKDLAFALSRLCQLAHASAVAIDSRERAVTMAEELEINTERSKRRVRPSISGKTESGQSSKNGTGALGGPSSTEEAAAALLDQVRGR